MYKYLIWLLLASTCFSQETLEYELAQATFLKADSAVVFPEDEGVTIQVEGLTPESTQGLVLSITNLVESEIEVTTLIDFNGLTVGLYPPQYKSPNKNGNYIILGDPGQRFGIRGRTENGIKQIFATIKGPTPAPDPIPDPTPNPPKLSEITKIVQTALDKLDDPVTASYIRSSLSKIEYTGELAKDTKSVKDAISTALTESAKVVKPPYKDWEGLFRKPLDQAIKVNSSSELKQVVDTIVQAIPNTQTSASSNKITMFTRPDCTWCEKWNNEVRPLLKDWIIEEKLHNGEVPSFVICVDGLCSSPYVGYLSIADFNSIVRSLRN